MTNDPNWRLPEVPAFTLTSTDFEAGGELPASARSGIMDAGGQDRSPALAWSGAPEGTKSFALTVYDPDAPTGSGFWHWSVRDIPGSATSLPADAGNPDAGLLPEGADPGPQRDPLDATAAPGRRPGTGSTVTSSRSPRWTSISSTFAANATPAMLDFMLREHVLARAQLIGTTESH